MRLLHLISEKPPVKSGFSRVIGRLAEELIRMGHVVDVFSAQDCDTKMVGDVKFVVNFGEVDRLMRNGGYDVMNIHGHTPTFSDRLLLRAKFSGKRIVYTFHCPVDGFSPLSTVYNAIFNGVLLRFVDAVVFTSKSYFDVVHTSVRKYIVPWGVDDDLFRGGRIPHDGYRLLFVGQMRPYKGLEVLLQAVRGMDATLSVVGDGFYRARYEDYARKLGLNNVRFYGAVGDGELKRIYLSSDVLVLPSVGANEAFGLVTLEAAAAGCAVVASDLPGVRDVVKDFGLLVRPNDPVELRDALLALRDEDVRRSYVAKGMRVVANYSWRRVAEEYNKIYADVVQDVPYQRMSMSQAY